MHLLPLNLGVVADHADPKEGARWATTGVHLELSDGRFLAAATDCKQLFEVSGPVAGDAADYPTWPALEAAPNGATHGLIPLKVWRSFFATAKKATPKRTTRPELKAVAVKLSPNAATLGCTDLESHPTEATRLVEGKFPPHRQIWPTKKPAVVVHLDPEYVAKAAKSLASFAEETDDSAKRMVVEVIDATKPVVFRVERADGTVARALVMPLGQTGREGPPALANADERTGDEDAVVRLNEAMARLRQELGDMTEERNGLARKLEAARKQTEYDSAAIAAYLSERDAALEKVESLERAAVKPARKPRAKRTAAVAVAP